MANGFGSLYIGVSGLQSAQNALNVTANNLANVDTKGYVREQVIFSDKDSIKLKDERYRVMIQQSGLGVSIGDVVHARDIFLDKAFRSENGRRDFYQTCTDTVRQVEDIMQELDGQRFKQSISDLEKAFQELAKAPADTVNQNLLVQKGELLISRSEAAYKSLQQYQGTLNGKVEEQVHRVNEIGQRIWDLNQYIQKVEAGGVETAMTHRDERDLLLDELSGYAHISASEDQFGFVTVSIEGVDFVEEKGCNAIGLDRAYGTGFYTPYWPQLSDMERKQYMQVFRTDVDISTENNNDIGSIKALLFQRGNEYGRYQDLDNLNSYSVIQDCVCMETQAQLDSLFHNIITTFNDIFAPNMTVEEDITDAAGNVVIAAGTRILDTENCPVGVDGQLPPRELFSRIGCERYTEVEVDGTTYYVYNEEQAEDSFTHYAIGNVEIDKELSKQAALLPGYTQNGAVDHSLGDKFIAAWEAKDMTLNPADKYPVNFLGYYDKLMGNLGTVGNIYQSSTDTLDGSVESIDNKRLQITGVSSEEELTTMIKYQSAYNAASRYMTVISQMTELIVTGLI